MSRGLLRIDLLGRFRVSLDGEVAGTSISSRGQEILALLVLDKGERLSRERIASRIWPDSNEAQARTNLRRELHQLRRTLPLHDEAIDDSGTHLSLRVQTVRSDVIDLEAALARVTAGPGEIATLTEIARIYGGDAIPECFADWLAPVRERLRDRAVVALRRLTELLEQRRDLVEGIRWARRLTEIDPLDEIAYRAQMRLCAAASDRAAALHAFHRCAHLLERELGVEPAPETRALYQKLVEHPVEPSASLQSPKARSLVGRRRERERLMNAWRADGGGQRVACIVGEPGIGKSRLADEVARQAERDGARVARARAYAAEGQLSYAPIVEWLRSSVIAPHIGDVDLPWREEIARLLPETSGARAARKSEESAGGDDAYRRRILFEGVCQLLLAGERPTVLVLDDLQWCDPDTLAFLHYVSRHESAAPLLVIATARSVELEDNQAARRLLLALMQEGQLLEIELGPLAAADVAELVRATGHEATPEMAERLHALSEGNPLFALEALRANLHTPGNLVENSPRVRAVLTARLGQLGARARELARFAATIGRAFDVDVLRAAADLEEGELVAALDELWRRRIVREHSAGGYDFTHDALREAATIDLSPERARLLHRRVAQAFELVHASRLDDLSAELASHYDLAGMPERAAGYYRRAARGAALVYAHDRAVALRERALSLVTARPPSRQRDSDELELLLECSPSLRAIHGYNHPRLFDLLERARTIAESLDDAPALFQVLRNLWGMQFVAGDLKGTLATANEMLELASVLPGLEAIGHHVIAGALMHTGELGAAIDHFEAARVRYDPKDAPQHLSVFGSDLGVFNGAWAAHALWLYGLEDRAITSANDAVQLARVLGHAYSEALAQAYAAVLHYMRRDRKACAEAAGAARELCLRHGFAYYGHWGTILGAWAAPGDPAEASRTIREALAALDEESSWARRPIYLAALAEVLADAGRTSEALETLDQAEARAASSGDRIWSAELARLRVALVPGHSLDQAKRALDLATELRARPLVVRSAVTLADAMRHDRPRAARLLREALADLPDGGSSFDRDRATQMLATLDRA